ncbi:type III pantothenate kinase [Colwellia sp. RE-S-Sl-9]
MIILVDIGNTRTKYRIEDIDIKNKRIVIENNQITKQWLTEYWGKANQIIVGSVKLGALTDLIATWAKENHSKIFFIESEKERFGIINSYEQPKSLGVDRWLTLVGASALFPKTGVVIIDAGTATTFDVLDQDGKHQGGWILSGIDLLLAQLSSNTSKVKFDVSDSADTAFGKSTSECVNNAAWAATIAMINSGIKIAEHTQEIKHCILLGGNAERILPFIEFPKVEIIHDLIFEGLKRYSA